jgi:hypothetical protein
MNFPSSNIAMSPRGSPNLLPKAKNGSSRYFNAIQMPDCLPQIVIFAQH